MRILSDVDHEEYISTPGWRKYKGKCPTCLNSGSYKYNGDTYICGDEDDYHAQRDLWKLYCLSRLPEEHCRLEWGDWPVKEVTSMIENYIENFSASLRMGAGLLISAKNLGIGKTWAAVHVLQELVKLEFTAFFVPFWDVKNIFQMDNATEKSRIIRRLRESQIVVIDDILMPVSVAQERLFEDKLEEVLRFRTMSNLPTIITTNLVDKEFEGHYPRVHSLLSGKQIDILLPGRSDYRKRFGAVEEDWRMAALRGEVRPLT